MRIPDRSRKCRPEKPITVNSLIRQPDSLFTHQEILFPEEQGISCKLLNPLGDRLPNEAKGPESGEISKNSLFISLLSGNPPQR